MPKLPFRLTHSLRGLRPGRFALAHLLLAAAGLAIGVLTDRLEVAMPVTLAAGLALHLAGQARGRRRTQLAEQRFLNLVEQLPAALYLSSLDTSSAEYVSPGIVALLGYELSDWRDNRNLYEERLHPLDRDGVLGAAEAARRAGDPYQGEYRLLRKDGSIVWVFDSAVTVRDERGRALHRQGFLIDTTAQKQAEARYRTLAEQLPLITYIDTPYSDDEAAAYVSPQIEEILGYTVEEWQSDPQFFVDHLHPEDRERVREAQRKAREGGMPLQIDYRFLARDGRTVWLQDSYTIVRDEAGRPWYSQGYALDITARRQAEADREALLAHEQLQNERLRELDRMKDEFVALVSHELRTPLTSIRGYLELLLDDIDASDFTSDHVDWLSVIDRNAVRLLSLVEDLLLKAQVSAGKVSFSMEATDVATIVEQSVKTSALVAATRSIALSCSTGPLPLLTADPVRLGQVIDNLISNALKFTKPGDRVDVRAFEQGARVRIEVTDTGIGIPVDEQERLFERFYRTSSARTNAVAGVGLGLSIAKAIVEGHGGEIGCRSAEGVGTTFFVDLPVASPVPAIVSAA